MGGTAGRLGQVLSSSYYIGVLCLAATYFWMRAAYYDVPIKSMTISLNSFFGSAPQVGNFGTWEVQMATAIFCSGAMRMFKAGSLEGTCFSFLGTVQLFVLVMAFLVDQVGMCMHAMVHADIAHACIGLCKCPRPRDGYPLVVHAATCP